MNLGWVSILRHNRTVTVRDSFCQQLSPVCFTMKHLTTKNVRLYFFTAFFICLAFRCLLGMDKTTRSFSPDRERLKITPRVCQTSSSDWNPWKKSKTWRLLKNRVWIIAPENASGKNQLRSCSSNPRIPQKKQTSKQKTKKKPLIHNKYRIKLLPKRLEGRRQNLNSNAHFLRL